MLGFRPSRLMRILQEAEPVVPSEAKVVPRIAVVGRVSSMRQGMTGVLIKDLSCPRTRERDHFGHRRVRV